MQNHHIFQYQENKDNTFKIKEDNNRSIINNVFCICGKTTRTGIIFLLFRFELKEEKKIKCQYYDGNKIHKQT